MQHKISWKKLTVHVGIELKACRSIEGIIRSISSKLMVKEGEGRTVRTK